MFLEIVKTILLSIFQSFGCWMELANVLTYYALLRVCNYLIDRPGFGRQHATGIGGDISADLAFTGLLTAKDLKFSTSPQDYIF